MALRNYQEAAASAAVEWLSTAKGSGGIIVAPTGSGKSHVIAEICKRWLGSCPNGVILILTTSREIILQDARILQNAGVITGICCAGLKSHVTPANSCRPVILATPTSLHERDLTGSSAANALVIIDEAHRVDVVKQNTRFRAVIDTIRTMWPNSNLIGLTATPWRLDAGNITQNEIWPDVLYTIPVAELIDAGFLAPVCAYERRVYTDTELAAAKSHGEYSDAVLGASLISNDVVGATVAEICNLMAAENRNHALVFCPTVAAAELVSEYFVAAGRTSVVVSGTTPKKERDNILESFKAGKIQVVCNCALLTTGFDAPLTDLIVLFIATLSRAKYYQIIGRGMRPTDGKKDCIIVDGGGNVLRHGLDPDTEEETDIVSCPVCGKIHCVDLEQRTHSGNFFHCACGARLFQCYRCGKIWEEQTTRDKYICPQCTYQVYPPHRGWNGGTGGGKAQELQLRLPMAWGEALTLSGGKTYHAFAPIKIEQHLSRVGNPCLLVKNAFKDRNAYVMLSNPYTRAALGYIFYDTYTDVRYGSVPSYDRLWLGCKKPVHHVVAAAGYLQGDFPKITHFLILTPEGTYESVDILTNTVKPEMIENEE